MQEGKKEFGSAQNSSSSTDSQSNNGSILISCADCGEKEGKRDCMTSTERVQNTISGKSLVLCKIIITFYFHYVCTQRQWTYLNDGFSNSSKETIFFLSSVQETWLRSDLGDSTHLFLLLLPLFREDDNNESEKRRQSFDLALNSNWLVGFVDKKPREKLSHSASMTVGQVIFCFHHSVSLWYRIYLMMM